MSKKAKTILLITGISVDVAITVFLFVISIIMLATMPANSAAMELAQETNGRFIGYLQQHSTVYFWTCVAPLFVLLVANIVGLIVYVKKAGKKPQVKVSDLDTATKEALKAELLKDLNKEDK